MSPFSAQALARALSTALRRLAAGRFWTTAGVLPLVLGATDGAVTGLVTSAAAMPAAVLTEWALNQITARQAPTALPETLIGFAWLLGGLAPLMVGAAFGWAPDVAAFAGGLAFAALPGWAPTPQRRPLF